MNNNYMNGLTLVREYNSDIIKGYKEYDSELACPKCGAHRFTLEKRMDRGYYENVLHCDTDSLNRYRPRCTGRIAFCEQCGKWYPLDEFVESGNKYVCGKCGTPSAEVRATMNIIEAKRMVGILY